jgi:beta-N-acetylhexosaminidase
MSNAPAYGRWRAHQPERHRSASVGPTPKQRDTSERLRALIRDIPDFPRPGILFKDIAPLLADRGALALAVQGLADYAQPRQRANPRRTVAVASMLCLATVSMGCGRSSDMAARTTVRTLSVARVASTAPSINRPASTPASALATPAASTPQAPASAPAPIPATPPRPQIVQSPIPFGAKRKAEMVRYAQRHYGVDTYRLIDPHVIVIHYTETHDFQSTFNTFAPDVPDSELHELPNTCAHFVIDRDGTIHQLVPLGIMCRHTVGLNWTAIGIEHVGYSDAEVLGDHAQMRSSLRLVRWLRCRFHISIANVIGHNESLSSPYHHEDVPALQTQTHSDFNHADMQHYRARLETAGSC